MQQICECLFYMSVKNFVTGSWRTAKLRLLRPLFRNAIENCWGRTKITDILEIFWKETVSLQLFKNQKKGWSIFVLSWECMDWPFLFYQIYASQFFMVCIEFCIILAFFMKTIGKEIRKFQGYMHENRLILSCEKHQLDNG